MRDEPIQRDDAGDGRPEIHDLGTLIRAGADGELTPAEAARLEAHLASNQTDRSRVAFEQGLRAACGRVMGAGACPGALRARIERAVAAEAAEAGAPADDGLAERLSERAAETRSRSFWTSGRAMPVLGAAAAVVLMFTVGGLLLRGTGPGAGGPGPIAGSAPVPPVSAFQTVAYRDEVAQFVAREHERCWESDEAADRKFNVTDRSGVVDAFRERLGSAVHIPALDQPVEAIKFRGAGGCHLPRTDKTMHLRWDMPAQDGRAASAVSMFVAPDNGMLQMREGITYVVNTKACGEDGMSLLVWTKDGLMFCLVSEAETGGCEKFRGAMGAPEPTEGL